MHWSVAHVRAQYQDHDDNYQQNQAASGNAKWLLLDMLPLHTHSTNLQICRMGIPREWKLFSGLDSLALGSRAKRRSFSNWEQIISASGMQIKFTMHLTLTQKVFCLT